MAIGDLSGSINTREEMERNLPFYTEIQKKKVLTDLMWEKIRQYIRTLPLHKQIEINGKIMKNDLNMS